MAKDVATTKWCPCCNHSQKIKGFRSFRCRDCWVAAGRPKLEVHFKAMDKPKPKKAAIKETPKTAPNPIDYKPIVLIEDRKKPRKKATKKATKKTTKKVGKKIPKKIPKKTTKKVTKKATKKK